MVKKGGREGGREGGKEGYSKEVIFLTHTLIIASTSFNLAVDIVCCFLLRQGLVCALPSVTAMVQVCPSLPPSLPPCLHPSSLCGHFLQPFILPLSCSSFTPKPSSLPPSLPQQLYGLSLSLPDLSRLCSAAPQALALYYVPTTGGHDRGGEEGREGGREGGVALTCLCSAPQALA